MNIQDYIQYWEEQDVELDKIQLQSIHAIPLPVELLDFLSMVGLPKESAPYVTFNLSSFPAFVSPDDFFELDRIEFSDWFIIGETTDGDPICIDPMNGYRICYLETEHDFNVVFMNSSVEKLAICLVLYETFIEKFSVEEDEQLHFNDSDWEYLTKQFKEIDAEALQEGSFWQYYLDYLFVERA